MVIIDIGCGRKKLKGSIGIDFSSMSNADIVLDLNINALPFDDSSVDFIHTSHALEHLTVDGFLNVIRECYRVLRPDGQMYILVPYFATSLNLANIFHNNQICFNEHTFRFFSSDTSCAALQAAEYSYPSCPHWGLRYSANSEIQVEFRTEKIDFIYMPTYQGLSPNELAEARRSKLDVVEQIAYHLKPVKPCPVRPERGPVDDGTDPHEFISGQIEHLKLQLEHIKATKALAAGGVARQVERLLFDAETLANDHFDWIRLSDLYTANGLLFPPHDVIRQLYSVIQTVQAGIDEIQKTISQQKARECFLQKATRKIRSTLGA